MRLAKKVRTPINRLGEIFLEAGIISPEVLDQGLVIAKRATMPLGRVLVMSGHVSELDVECALVTQVSIRDGAIDVRMAKEILRFAHVHQVTIEEAYRLNGIVIGLGPLPRMGKLVMAAGIVDEAGLSCALSHSKTTGYPLGRALVELEMIDEKLLSNCLNLQILLRDNQLTFLEAVRVLQEMYYKKISLEAALKIAGVKVFPKPNHVRLGDILVQAGLLAGADSVIICELGTENDTTFGQLLLQYELVTPLVVEAAAQLQRMMATTQFSKSRAFRLLNLVHTMKVPLEKLIKEFDVLDQMLSLLRSAEVIDERTMRETAVSIKDFEYSVAEVLIQRGTITKEMSRTSLVLIQEIERGVMTYEKALEALHAFRDPYELYRLEWERALAARTAFVTAA